MPNISKFFKLNFNLVAEYEYADESNLLSEDFWIIYYKEFSYFHYCQDIDTFGNLSTTNNVYLRQLKPVDSLASRWTQLNIEDPTIRAISYSANDPLPYDTVKVHFPVDFIFENLFGILIKVWVYDFSNKNKIYLSQYYYDKELHFNSPFGNLELTSPRLRFEDNIYGKYLSIKIPATYYVARQRIQTNITNIVKPGSLNDVISTGVGLSMTSPVYLEFSYLTKKSTIDNSVFYTIGNTIKASTPQAAEYQTLGIRIEENTNNDWFEIVGVYNESASGFAQFILNLDYQGNRSFVKYDVTIIEQNIPGRTQTYIVEENYFNPIVFIPPIAVSTTTVAIDVDLRIVSYLDGSEVVRSASINLTQEQINKYGRRKAKINIQNAFKPKIYNPVPDQNILTAPINNTIIDQQTNIVYYPLLYEKNNIVIKDVSSDSYVGNEQLVITLNPYTNVFKFIVASAVTSTEVQFLNLPTNTRVQMVFSYQNLNSVSELFFESQEVDLTKGVLIFMINPDQAKIINKIYRAGGRRFSLLISNNNAVESILYTGFFEITS